MSDAGGRRLPERGRRDRLRQTIVREYMRHGRGSNTAHVRRRAAVGSFSAFASCAHACSTLSLWERAGVRGCCAAKTFRHRTPPHPNPSTSREYTGTLKGEGTRQERAHREHLHPPSEVLRRRAPNCATCWSDSRPSSEKRRVRP